MRHNLRTLFGVSKAPCDTQMRSLLDPIDPSVLRPAFRALHSAVQRGNVLGDFVYLKDAYLLSIDGTGLFSSTRVSCPHCCEKKTRGGIERPRTIPSSTSAGNTGVFSGRQPVA